MKLTSLTTKRKLCVPFLSILFLFAVLTTIEVEAGQASSPTPIEIIAGDGEDTGYHVRYRTVRRLSGNLSAQEIETAIRFLGVRPEDDPLPATALNAIKNDLVIALINQETPPPGLGDLLIGHFNDETMDNGWRDYCLQLLRTWYPKASPQEREGLVDFYLEVTDSTEATFSGTAVLALKNLAGDYGAVDFLSVAERANAIAVDLGQTPANRAAALQVGAELDHPGILVIARGLGYDSDQTVFLRMAAIAAIGKLGDENDLADLGPLSESSDVRLRAAAEWSVERLRD